MVTNELWAAAGLKRDDNVCPLCLEKRIGRPLTQEDFTPFPCNRIIRAHGVQAHIDFWKPLIEEDYRERHIGT